MNLPLYRHPGTLVFVDDDINFLSAIKTTLPENLSIEAFESPVAFTQYMTTQAELTKDVEEYHRGVISRVKQGRSVATEVLRYWNAFPDRYAIPQSVVIDYHMPGLTGLQALAQSAFKTEQSILLTGVADEAVVCKAFNDRLIDYYIPKQSSKIINQIVSTLEMMRNNYLNSSSQKWNAWFLSLQAQQLLMLSEPRVGVELFRFVGSESEHVTIGDPFGVLALGYAGGVKWLQLETSETLDAAADLLLKLNGSREDAQSVRVGRSLTDARIKQSLRIDEEPSCLSCSFQIRIPCANETIYGAVFDLNALGAPAPEMCYSAWHARRQQA